MIRLTAEFRDFDDVLFDPDTVVINVYKNGAEKVVDAVAMTNQDEGVYYYDYSPSRETYIKTEIIGTTGGVDTVIESSVIIDTFYKKALRVSGTALDEEIVNLIDSAKRDLAISGISTSKETSTGVMDPLLKRAITTYCKANFGYDNPDAEKLMESYRSLKIHMALSEDYQVVI